MYIPKRNQALAAKYDNMDIVETYADLPAAGDPKVEKVYYVKDTKKNYFYDKVNSIYVQIINEVNDTRLTAAENNIITLNTFKGNQETLNTDHTGQLAGLQTDISNFNGQIVNIDNSVSLNTSSINTTNTRVFALEQVNTEYRIGNLETADGVQINRIQALETGLPGPV